MTPKVLRRHARHSTFSLSSSEVRTSRLFASERMGRARRSSLTAANVVHLGLLAPGFARQVLTDKVGQQPGAVATFVRHTAMNANLRFIEILLTLLERGGGRFDFPTTERRARALASKLVERADKIASSPARPAKELR